MAATPLLVGLRWLRIELSLSEAILVAVVEHTGAGYQQRLQKRRKSEILWGRHRNLEELQQPRMAEPRHTDKEITGKD